MRTVYRARHEQIVGTLRGDFADELTVIPSAAGIHVSALARRHSDKDVATVVAVAARRGVAVQTLSAFAVGDATRPGLLLGYAIPTANIDEGLRRLHVALSRALRA